MKEDAFLISGRQLPKKDPASQSLSNTSAYMSNPKMRFALLLVQAFQTIGRRSIVGHTEQILPPRAARPVLVVVHHIHDRFLFVVVDPSSGPRVRLWYPILP